MLKNIQNLKGAQQLTKGEQKSINGGKIPADYAGSHCNEFVIIPLNQASCLAYNADYRPVYIGNNQCSILMPPCKE